MMHHDRPNCHIGMIVFTIENIVTCMINGEYPIENSHGAII